MCFSHVVLYYYSDKYVRICGAAGLKFTHFQLSLCAIFGWDACDTQRYLCMHHFARTMADLHHVELQGTIVVVCGVVGIVAFGSINSGLTSEIDAARLSALWGRAGWLAYLFAMTFALILLLIFITRLEGVLSARNEITPGSEDSSSPKLVVGTSCWDSLGVVGRAVIALRSYWRKAMVWTTEKLEVWAGPKPDKQVAWTLGIGWACGGGGLAGGCLVFAKARFVVLISNFPGRELNLVCFQVSS